MSSNPVIFPPLIPVDQNPKTTTTTSSFSTPSPSPSPSPSCPSCPDPRRYKFQDMDDTVIQQNESVEYQLGRDRNQPLRSNREMGYHAEMTKKWESVNNLLGWIYLFLFFVLCLCLVRIQSVWYTWKRKLVILLFFVLFPFCVYYIEIFVLWIIKGIFRVFF